MHGFIFSPGRNGFLVGSCTRGKVVETLEIEPEKDGIQNGSKCWWKI